VAFFHHLLRTLAACAAPSIFAMEIYKFYHFLVDNILKFVYNIVVITKEEKGARLGFALISNHAFVNGNKRIGMYVLLTFLETNGIKLRPTNAEVARVGLAVAAGEMKYQELLDWILDNEV
jgi:death-on-curing family protein